MTIPEILVNKIDLNTVATTFPIFLIGKSNGSRGKFRTVLPFPKMSLEE